MTIAPRLAATRSVEFDLRWRSHDGDNLIRQGSNLDIGRVGLWIAHPSFQGRIVGIPPANDDTLVQFNSRLAVMKGFTLNGRKELPMSWVALNPEHLRKGRL